MGSGKRCQTSIRFTKSELDHVDSSAARAGLTRSDYIRLVLSIPLEVIIEAERANMREGDAGAQTGAVGDGPASAAPSVGAAVDGVGVVPAAGSGSVLLVSDKGLADLRVAIDRWGVNYNQGVRAINTVASRFVYVRSLHPEEYEEIMMLLRSCAHACELSWRGIKRVHEDIGMYLGGTVADIGDYGFNRKGRGDADA